MCVKICVGACSCVRVFMPVCVCVQCVLACVVNPRRACARVTVVVCLSVCLFPL